MEAIPGISQPLMRFEIFDDKSIGKKPKPPKTSLERLIYNSENIAALLTSRKELQTLRFDEFDLLRDIRDLVEADPGKFESLKNPAEFRREIRAKILPKYVTPAFTRITQEKLLNELLRTSRAGTEQDSLMTALVFLQSHTDLGLAMEDNPLWEIIFNLSIKDGLKFIDLLTVLIEGLDSLKTTDPEILIRDPLILQKTKQICQWPIFWKQIISHQEIEPFEAIISAILRGDLMIEIYFDEMVHLPYFLHQLFRAELHNENFLSEAIPDGTKAAMAQQLYQTILKSVEKDWPFFLPLLLKRIKSLLKKARLKEYQEQLELVLEELKTKAQFANNIFLITLLAAKISMKKYWENQRDRFFFFTILKNPLDAKNYYDFGQILLKQKQSATAEQLFRCAIEIDPQSFWGYWGLGSYFLKHNIHLEAEKLYDSALKLVQQSEIHHPNTFRRELFLIKEDMKKLKEKKLKMQSVEQPQIDLFALA